MFLPFAYYESHYYKIHICFDRTCVFIFLSMYLGGIDGSFDNSRFNI